MEAKTLPTNLFTKARPARAIPLAGAGTLLDDWGDRAFGALKYELPRRRS